MTRNWVYRLPSAELPGKIKRKGRKARHRLQIQLLPRRSKRRPPKPSELPAICSSPRIMPWLTNNSCALALALNSTGKVSMARRNDDPKRITPAQVRVSSCRSTPMMKSQGATCAAISALSERCKFELPWEVVLSILQGMPSFMSRYPRSRYAGEQSTPAGLGAMSWSEDRSDRSECLGVDSTATF